MEHKELNKSLALTYATNLLSGIYSRINFTILIIEVLCLYGLLLPHLLYHFPLLLLFSSPFGIRLHDLQQSWLHIPQQRAFGGVTSPALLHQVPTTFLKDW